MIYLSYLLLVFDKKSLILELIFLKKGVGVREYWSTHLKGIKAQILRKQSRKKLLRGDGRLRSKRILLYTQALSVDNARVTIKGIYLQRRSADKNSDR